LKFLKIFNFRCFLLPNSFAIIPLERAKAVEQPIGFLKKNEGKPAQNAY
jgi:hypothetical protein